MKKKTNSQNVKMNLSVDREFFDLLQHRAKTDYMKVATWTKQYLKKHLLEQNNDEKQVGTNGNAV
jgi:hypothetical protein